VVEMVVGWMLHGTVLHGSIYKRGKAEKSSLSGVEVGHDKLTGLIIKVIRRYMLASFVNQ
jgi:hypothetical protein